MRQHPIKIASYFTKRLWILVFPLFRSITYSQFRNMTALIYASRISIILAVVFLFAGWLRWRSCQIMAENGRLTIKSGVFIRKLVELPADKISSFSAAMGVRTNIIGAVRVQVCSVKKRREFLMRREDFTELSKKLGIAEVGNEYETKKARFRERLLF